MVEPRLPVELRVAPEVVSILPPVHRRLIVHLEIAVLVNLYTK